MPPSQHNPGARQPADWAVEQARDDLHEVDDDPQALAKRARELMREAAEREEERHDEYDDPDQGGEA